MRIVKHGNGIVSIVQDVGNSTKENKDGSVRHRRGGRTRILLQLVNGKPRVIRGSMFLSGAEIERILVKA